MTKIVRAATTVVRVYLAGDIGRIQHVCAAFCKEEGLCVTVTPTTYVHTDGSECGVEIGLVNYPRFPTDATKLTRTARRLAEVLLDGAHQQTALVVAPNDTFWLTRRPA